MVAWGWLIAAWLLGCLSVGLPILFWFLDAKTYAQAVEDSETELNNKNQSTED